MIAVTVVTDMFSLENATIIHVMFLGYPIDGSSGLLMLIVLGVGVLLGVILMLLSFIGNSWALMRHKRKLAEFEQQPAKKPGRTLRRKMNNPKPISQL